VDLPAFQSVLRRLKTEGCNLLVVGDPPREVFTRASRCMLGDPDARRWRVLALTDASPESVADRIPAASAGSRSPADATTVVNHAPPSRPTTDSVETPVASVPEVDVGDADLVGLRTAVVDAVREFCDRSFRPAEVRVAVDSLSPLLDHHETAAVRRFLRTVGECVHECDAMAHYVLPEPYGSDRCQRLVGEFDAVIELRTAPADDRSGSPRAAEERWHLPESGTTMPWVPVRNRAET
jgi:hypothetical protein